MIQLNPNITKLSLSLTPVLAREQVFAECVPHIRHLTDLELNISWRGPRYPWDPVLYLGEFWNLLRGNAGTLLSLKIDLCYDHRAESFNCIWPLMWRRDKSFKGFMEAYSPLYSLHKKFWNSELPGTSKEQLSEYTWPTKMKLRTLCLAHIVPFHEHSGTGEADFVNKLISTYIEPQYLESVDLIRPPAVDHSRYYSADILTGIKSWRVIRTDPSVVERVISPPNVETLAFRASAEYHSGRLILPPAFDQFPFPGSVKSLWFEIYAPAEHRELNWASGALDITLPRLALPELRELAMTQTVEIMGPLEAPVSSKVRILCFIQLAPGPDRVRYCKLLFAKYAEQQMSERQGPPALEIVAVGSPAVIGEASPQDLVIIAGKHTIAQNGEIETTLRCIDLEEVDAIAPWSAILGTRKGPWGWWRELGSCEAPEYKPEEE
ncbi:hypothetical protein Dda_5950 [Drechslerella dactyloides]|uniref:Uncharacterized protein n=1 Tax=Drechslerella dactyloides TaxID=74499 RepID=A0AAD6IUP5_DREDA|nr:hypothetical protein Dda_5950 [Drechslerella dactyloides]